MLLSGQLSDWTVEDLLQMLHITKKTASLHVDGTERSGVVYFDEGAIVGVEVSVGAAGGDARETAVEALYVLQLLGEGEFEIRNQVPPTAIDPMSVAEALELASAHLAAERALGESGLLGARGLRLAQQVDEPIILSEQVWAAISVSIPAFTFAELEGRMGRAAAVDTLEQFRELGVLEAVLDEPAEDVASIEVVEVGDPMAYELGEDIVPVVDPDTVIEPESESPSMWMADETEIDEVSDGVEGSGWDSWTGDEKDEIEVTDDPPSEWEGDDNAEPEEAVASAPSSLSDAIRAAAAAAQAAGIQVVDESGDTDDESRLLAEASSTGHSDGGGEGRSADGPLRRTVNSLVSSSDSDQVQGVLDSLGARFREASD